MAIVDLVMPKMGESIVEATIIAWLKGVGDTVEYDDPVLEIATDKVDSEVPATASGTIVEIIHKKDAVVSVGGVLARIETEEGESNAKDEEATASEAKEPIIEPPKSEVIQAAVPKTPEREAVKISEPPKTVTSSLAAAEENDRPNLTPSFQSKRIPSNAGGQFFSPLVRNMARVEGISLEELKSIPGTGGDNRITKVDLLNYIERKKLGHLSSTTTPLIKQSSETSFSEPIKKEQPTSATPIQKRTILESTGSNASDDIIELDRMRQMIAKHMKHSQEVSATVTSVVEADATHLVHWRNRVKKEYQEKHGEKLTFSPLFAEAVIKAIGDYPSINASLVDDKLHLKKDINLGIATAMDNGNLIVPIIKKAQQLSLVGLTSNLNDLATRARSNQLAPDEIQGGTFTISNIGTYGNIIGTPIISQPQLAILALGAIKKKPVIKETPHGDIIAIRHMMFLSLSFDHRVIDGYLGGVFLNRIAHYIEAFDPNRSF